MSHLLGPLSDCGPALTLHSTAKAALLSALEACADHRYAYAACELEAAADCNVTLARMLADRDPRKARHFQWRADQSETWAYQAWAAARADEGVEVPR